jgi:hypothetical protein
MGGFISEAAMRGRRGTYTSIAAALALVALAVPAGTAVAQPDLDSIAPTVSIDAPSGHVAPAGKLRLYFSADETGVAFACQVDDGAAAPCASPQDFTLAAGDHTVAVSATDAAGNTSAPVTWDVTATPPPTVTIIISDPGPTPVGPPVAPQPQPRTPRLEIGTACMEVSASRAHARLSLRGRTAIVRFRAPAAARYATFTLRRARGAGRHGAAVAKLASVSVRAGATNTARIALTRAQRRLVRGGAGRLAVAYGTCRSQAGEWQWVATTASSHR